MSWASVAVTPVAKPRATTLQDDDGKELAVLDANAIISGEGLLQLAKLANRMITTPEVLAEVRDKKSRSVLAALPYTIEEMEPSEDDTRAVLDFARKTGDAHALSHADIRLIALARTLEVARHGAAGLRTEPPPVTLSSRRPRPTPGSRLPGWGDKNGTWAELDRINAEEEAANKALLNAVSGRQPPADVEKGASRIAAELQTLSLDAEDGDQADDEPCADGLSGSEEGGEEHTHVCEAGESPLTTEQHDQASDAHPIDVPTDQDNEGLTALASHAATAEIEQSLTASAVETRDEDWVVAVDHKRHRQKGKKKSAAGPRPHQYRSPPAGASRGDAHKAPETPDAPATGADTETAKASTSHGATATGAVSIPAGLSSPPTPDAPRDSGSDQPPAPQPKSAASSAPQASSAASSAPQASSSVCILTGDFAMQNVILQMGLQLVTRDHQRVTRLSRWVLRCSACNTVSKEVGRIFCPRCGNATMERVKMSVGADGAEQYGVRTRHNLRGTRFSLPKPKGGRGEILVLSEDILKKQAGAAMRRGQKKDNVDAFAPEFNQDTWHQSSSLNAVPYKGAAALLAGWKHNPNERKHRATNRRRK